MKLHRPTILVTIGLVLLICGAWVGAEWATAKHSSDENVRLASRSAATLGRDLVLLMRLGTNDLDGVRVLLELSVDSELVTLEWLGSEMPLSSSQERLLETVRSYRRDNPFDERDYGLDRGNQAREIIRDIVDRSLERVLQTPE